MCLCNSPLIFQTTCQQTGKGNYRVLKKHSTQYWQRWKVCGLKSIFYRRWWGGADKWEWNREFRLGTNIKENILYIYTYINDPWWPVYFYVRFAEFRKPFGYLRINPRLHLHALYNKYLRPCTSVICVLMKSAHSSDLCVNYINLIFSKQLWLHVCIKYVHMYISAVDVFPGESCTLYSSKAGKQ